MARFINYIKQGRGYGFLFLLAAAVIASLAYTMFVKDIYTEYRPKVIEVADKFLPITAKGGKIISPENTYREYIVDLGVDETGKKMSFPIIMDTREDTNSDMLNNIGMYILSDVIYVTSDDKVQKFSITDGTLDSQKFGDMIDQFGNIMTTILSVVVIICAFLLYLLQAMIVSGICCVTKKMMKITMFDFDTFMRMNSLIVSVFEVLMLILSFLCDFSVGFWESILIQSVLASGILFSHKLEK